jgi:putative peptidoglycan lipid II flippase
VPENEAPRSAKNAVLVAIGIFLSRIAGLVRQRVFAHYLGLSDSADAFSAAFRLPNFLQNLFGEGVLSASLIPVYARLLAEGKKEEATRVANVVGTLLALIVSVIVLAGVLAPDELLAFTALGFAEEKRAFTVRLVRLFFPGAGLLVMSAWCLGVLNSHRKFLLSYTAPVLWNLAVIAALIFYGSRGVDQYPLAEMAAIGSVAGSGIQFLVQLPTVFLLLGKIRPQVETKSENVRAVMRNFFPVFIARGVVQISAFVDQIIAGLLPSGAVAAITNAQTLYTLPISLFGMSISAAELPEMSSTLGTDTEVAARLRSRLDAGLRRIAFFVVPSAVAFLAFGDILAGTFFQTGQFDQNDSVYVWGILAGASFGLLPSTLGRLYSSTYYALRDTRTPLNFALLRVGLSISLGYLAALYLPPVLGLEARWGAATLTAASGAAGWIEFLLLRARLNRRIGKTGIGLGFSAKVWISAIAGAAIAWAIKANLPPLHPIYLLALAVGPFGITYFVLTYFLKVDQSRATIDRLLRRVRRTR